MPLQEACILTLCRLARFVHVFVLFKLQAPNSLHRVSDDEEKNIILLRLLEYLGHPNPYICAVAYNEVSVFIQSSHHLCNVTHVAGISSCIKNAN